MSHRSEAHARAAARGHVRKGARERLAETWFHWRDPETGERLEIALGVSDAFRERLAAAGFRPTAVPTRSETEPAPPSGGAVLPGRSERGRPGDTAGSAAPAA